MSTVSVSGFKKVIFITCISCKINVSVLLTVLC